MAQLLRRRWSTCRHIYIHTWIGWYNDWLVTPLFVSLPHLLHLCKQSLMDNFAMGHSPHFSHLAWTDCFKNYIMNKTTSTVAWCNTTGDNSHLYFLSVEKLALQICSFVGLFGLFFFKHLQVMWLIYWGSFINENLLLNYYFCNDTKETNLATCYAASARSKTSYLKLSPLFDCNH